AECRTAEEPLVGSEDIGNLEKYMDEFDLRSPIAKRSTKRLGSLSPEVLGGDDPNPVVCTCEAVTQAEIEKAMGESGTDLNAVRIRTRASMGNCQGAFCCGGIASCLHPDYDEPTVRDAYDELYQERWKGERHGLWGEQLSQAALKYALHATTMNRDGDTAASETEVDFGAFDDGGVDSGSVPGSERETATDGGDPTETNSTGVFDGDS